MTEQKPCVRCERAIDGWAKICPFCNWDQSHAAPAQPIAPPAYVADYKPPQESLKRYALMGIGGVLLLIAAFGVGLIINQDDAVEAAPEPVTEIETKVPPVRRADTPLVPMNEPGGIEQPITSAPAGPLPDGTSNEWERSDATAVSAVEYAELAKRAQAEKQKPNALVDPRTITGAAYQGSAPAASRGSTASAGVATAGRAVRTRPVPQYQPIPRISASGAARLDLIIGADGRVREINVRRAINGNNAALIGAVQSWRFKPATENGEPVAAPYSVEISFKQ
jgi:TonB family protein